MARSSRRLDGLPLAGDPGQNPPEHAAGGVHGVREIHDLHTDCGKITFQLLALDRSAPVVTLEQDVESDRLPRLELVGHDLRDGPIDVGNVRHDRQTLVQWDDWAAALRQLEHLVGDNAGDQEVTPTLRVTEQVEMTYMKEVISTGGIADPDGHVFSKGSDRQRAINR